MRVLVQLEFKVDISAFKQEVKSCLSVVFALSFQVKIIVASH